MANKKNDKEKTETTALASLTYEEHGVVRLAVQNMEPALREQVKQLMAETSAAIGEVGRSLLKMGMLLAKAKALLESRGSRTFVAYLNEIPGMSVATAYRWINAYNTSKERLPEVLLNRVLAANLPMIGDREHPFGKYTEVIAQKVKGEWKLRDKFLLPASCTQAQADTWIQKVEAAAKEEHARSKTSRVKLPNAADIQKNCLLFVYKQWKKLDKKKQTVTWLRETFGYVASAIGLAAVIQVEPKRVPTNWQKELPKEKVEKEEPEEPGTSEENE